MIDIIDSLILDKDLVIYAVFPNYEGSAIDYLRSKEIPVLLTRYDCVMCRWSELSLKYKIVNILLYFRGIFNTTCRIMPWIKKNNIDVVYSNTSVIYVGAWLKRIFPIRHIWHFREYPELGFHQTVLGGRKKFYKFVNKYCNKVITISDWLTEIYAQNIKKTPVERVYDDVSDSYLIFKKEKHEGINILIAGNIMRSKGQMDAVKAVELLHESNDNIHLYIAGGASDEYGKKVLSYIDKENRKDYIHYLGRVEDMNSIRKKMDIGIVASRYDAFGRTIIEGMLGKMVMFGASCCATRELIEDDRTGVLYRPGDYQQLADKISGLLNNKKKMEDIREAGFQYAIRFTKGNAAKEIRKCILE